MADDPSEEPWLGLLSNPPLHLAARLGQARSLTHLLSSGWDAHRTLLYAPRSRPGYDLNIVVVARTIAVSEQASMLWAFSTVGLCNIEQPLKAEAQAFRHVELMLVSNNWEREDPFPARIGVALDQGADVMPGWDWSQVRPPGILDWLAIAAEEVGLSMGQGSTFAIGDTLTLGPGNASWTRSKLGCSAILPPPPQMLAAGFGPFDSAVEATSAVLPDQWHQNPGTEQHAYGFYWLLPLSEAEYVRANSQGSWNVFADIIDAAPNKASDEFAAAFDLMRGSTPG